MKSSRYHRLEALVPAQSGAGIALFSLAVFLPVMLIPVTLRMLG